MRRQAIRHALTALLLLATVIATLAVRPASAGPRPGPLWESRSADTCSYPFAGGSWDANEPPRHSYLIGDSVVGQVSGVVPVLAAQRCHTINVWALSGAAPCDFLADYGGRLSTSDPAEPPAAVPLSRVVLAFVGNATSPCMIEHLKDSGVIAADATRPPATLTATQIATIGYWYEVDLRAMVRWNLAHNLQTVLVLPPEMNRGTWHGQVNDQLIGRYTTIGNAYGGVWVSAAARTAVGGDTYTPTIDGLQVRHTDGTHLAAPLGQSLYAAAVAAAGTL